MARRGLFQPDQVADRVTQTNFARVKDAVEKLAADHDVVSSPVANIVTSGNIPPGAFAVAFTGGPSQTLSLPPANVLGANVAAVVLFLNTSPNAVTLVPSRGDSLNGSTSLSVASNVLAFLASDGVSKWLRNV